MYDFQIAVFFHAHARVVVTLKLLSSILPLPAEIRTRIDNRAKIDVCVRSPVVRSLV